jgi:hypothetical protein
MGSHARRLVIAQTTAIKALRERFRDSALLRQRHIRHFHACRREKFVHRRAKLSSCANSRADATVTQSRLREGAGPFAWRASCMKGVISSLRFGADLQDPPDVSTRPAIEDRPLGNAFRKHANPVVSVRLAVSSAPVIHFELHCIGCGSNLAWARSPPGAYSSACLNLVRGDVSHQVQTFPSR